MGTDTTAGAGPAKRPRGRPRRAEPTRARTVRLTDAEWAALLAVARREGLSEILGEPSPGRAVAWLVRHDPGRHAGHGDPVACT